MTTSPTPSPSPAEFDRLLKLLEANVTVPPLKELLRPTTFNISGTKDELIGRVREGLEKGVFGFHQLTAFLDHYESYGHQHVYLFDLPPSLISQLRDRTHVENVTRSVDSELTLDVFRPLDLPSTPTLAGVSHSSQAVRVKWVEKREYLELVETDENDPNYDLVRRYQQKVQRRVNVLELDLDSCTAELRLFQLPRGEKYEEELDRFTQLAFPFVDLNAATVLDFRRVIMKTLTENDARVQSIDIYAQDWSSAGYSAPSVDHDVNQTAFLRSLPAALRNQCDGKRARIYWQSGDDEVSTTLYKDRIAFTTSAEKDEVTHVLQRIRSLV